MNVRPLSLVLVAHLVSACADPTFTVVESQLLHAMKLPARPTASHTNAVADDAAAQVLGHTIYFDPRFSGPLSIGTDEDARALGAAASTGRVSCNDCHDLAHGGADARTIQGTTLGANFTSRASPNMFYVADNGPFFSWDGGHDTLWGQVLFPIESKAAHNSSRAWVVNVLATHYRELWDAAFPEAPLPAADVVAGFIDVDDVIADKCPSAANVPMSTRGRPGDCFWQMLSDDERDVVDSAFTKFGKALEAYLRTLRPASSALDRYIAGDEDAFGTSANGEMDAVQGAKLFVGRAGCIDCHRGPLLANGAFHNLGVPVSSNNGAFRPPVDFGRADGLHKILDKNTGLPGGLSVCGSHADDDVNTDVNDAEVACARLKEAVISCNDDDDCATDEREICHRKVGSDPVAFGVCVSENDVGAFKVPTLRNVGRSAPFMHTGAFETLWDVVEFYNEAAGGDWGPGTRDRSIAPLHLEDDELSHLVAFLEALTDDEFVDEAPPTLPGCRAFGDACVTFAECCAGSMP